MERKLFFCLFRRLIYLYIFVLCKYVNEDIELDINLFFFYLRCDIVRGYIGNFREIGGFCI